MAELASQRRGFKIRTKLSAGFLVIGLAVGAVALLSSHRMSGLVDGVEEMVKHNRDVRLLSSMEARVLKVGKARLEAGQSGKEADHQRHDVLRDQLRKDLLEMQKLAQETNDAQEIAGLEKVIGAMNAYEKLKGTELRGNESAEHLEVIEHGLRGMIDGNVVEVTEHNAHVMGDVKDTKLWLLGISLAVLGLATLIGTMLTRGVLRPLNQLLAMLRGIADGSGDLTRRLEVDSKDEFGEVAECFNRFVVNLNQILLQVGGSTNQVAQAASQLASTANVLSEGAQQQASRLEETAASLEQITAAGAQNAANAAQASQLASGARQVAASGGTAITDAVAAMGEINRSSKKIAEIITAIDEIAFQTNLLALNAAVEAARAGEQGRGFAVVAAEVRNLAQRSATSAREIKDLIQDSLRKVDNGSQLVDRSGRTLDEIVASVKRVTDVMAEISSASSEQATGIQEVNRAVSQMDGITQRNAARTEEITATSQALAEQSRELQALIGRFRLDQRVAV